MVNTFVATWAGRVLTTGRTEFPFIAYGHADRVIAPKLALTVQILIAGHTKCLGAVYAQEVDVAANIQTFTDEAVGTFIDAGLGANLAETTWDAEGVETITVVFARPSEEAFFRIFDERLADARVEFGILPLLGNRIGDLFLRGAIAQGLIPPTGPKGPSEAEKA